MGYADYLRQLLSPMGVYELYVGYSAAELEAVGSVLDKIEGEIVPLKVTATAGEYLRNLEALFPIVNFAESEEERRDNVLTLLHVNDTWSDKASLEAVLAACGLDAVIVETADKFTVELHFPEICGELTDEEQRVCKAIMPAHVALRFMCEGLTWNRAEELFPTWDDFDNVGLTASELVKLA